MKYGYTYKTSDGRRHEASMEAASREEVFVALRAQGIKAIKVVAADGSKANGEVRGVRKRVVMLVAVGVALVAGVVAFALGRGRSPGRGAFGVPARADTAPRHQIYGDPAVMAAFEQGDFTGVFDCPGDELLAWFAQPGKLMCPPKANAVLCTDQMASNLLAVARARQGPRGIESSADSREVAELRQIVSGMREELRAYLANGNGTVYSYWRRLNERLAEEQQIYERTRREMEAITDAAIRDERNAALRAMGLRTIPRLRQGDQR